MGKLAEVAFSMRSWPFLVPTFSLSLFLLAQAALRAPSEVDLKFVSSSFFQTPLLSAILNRVKPLGVIGFNPQVL